MIDQRSTCKHPLLVTEVIRCLSISCCHNDKSVWCKTKVTHLHSLAFCRSLPHMQRPKSAPLFVRQWVRRDRITNLRSPCPSSCVLGRIGLNSMRWFGEHPFYFWLSSCCLCYSVILLFKMMYWLHSRCMCITTAIMNNVYHMQFSFGCPLNTYRYASFYCVPNEDVQWTNIYYFHCTRTFQSKIRFRPHLFFSELLSFKRGPKTVLFHYRPHHWITPPRCFFHQFDCTLSVF